MICKKSISSYDATHVNASCEIDITLKISHERTRSIPFPPTMEYPHSHSTPSSRVVESSFVGQRSFMFIEVIVLTLAPKVARSYNTRNTPKPMKMENPLWLHVLLVL